MKRYYVICVYIIAFLLQSCDNIDIPEKKYTEKKIEIRFEGKKEDVYPWLSFTAYTENHETLYVVQNKDTTINQDGTFYIERGKIPTSGQIVLYSKSWYTGSIHLGVNYRKRKISPSIPSKSDELKISVKGYVNNILQLDTVHVMHAFKAEEKISSSNYMFNLNF